MNGQTVQLLLLGVVVVVIILFMFRNGRKRQRDAQQMTDNLKPGAEIMTSSGIFGVVESIDAAENKIVLRTGPTSELTIHRQAIGRIVTPPDAGESDAATIEQVATLNGEPVQAGEPEYGQRVDPKDGDTTRGRSNSAD